MYELTSIFTTVSSCSATIVAILGGFIASKLIAISTERKEVVIRLKEVSEEIEFKEKVIKDKEKNINEFYALDFIDNNIKHVYSKRELELVYKDEDKNRIAKNTLLPYWEKAINLMESIKKELEKDEDFDELNVDDIPNKIVKILKDDFEYETCKYIFKYIEKLIKQQHRAESLFPTIDSYIDNVDFSMKDWKGIENDKNYINDIKISVEWLNTQKDQLLNRKIALESIKGIKLGMVIFSILSLVGIIGPLILIPYETNILKEYLILKSGVILIFLLILILVFWYFVYLYKYDK